MRLVPIFLLFFSCLTQGQELNNPNKLPPCHNGRYHNCWGVKKIGTQKNIGEYKNGTLNGLGMIYQGSKVDCFGIFKDGQQIKSVQYYSTELFEVAKYDGEWSGTNPNMWHGRGILTKKNGEVLEGIWENHKFIRAEKVMPISLAEFGIPSTGVEHYEAEIIEKNHAVNDNTDRYARPTKITNSQDRKLVQKNISPAPSPASSKKNGDFR